MQPQSRVAPDELRESVARLDWYHTIDLGNGIVTPGHAHSRQRLDRIGLPADLSGMSVLDVGAWDGWFSFEAERRGAGPVLATDSFIWQGKGWGSKEGFELARSALGSSVEDMEIDVLELSAQRPGVFDLVLFLGVLYHVSHPLLALERVAEVTGTQLIIETLVDLRRVRHPAVAFYPGDEVSGDPTTWWGPNPQALEAMLKLVGFRRVERVWQSWKTGTAALRPRRVLKKFGRALDRRRRRPRTLGVDRVVYHAFK